MKNKNIKDVLMKKGVIEDILLIAEFIALILAIWTKNDIFYAAVWLFALLYMATKCIRLVDEKTDANIRAIEAEYKFNEAKWILDETREMIKNHGSRDEINDFLDLFINNFELEKGENKDMPIVKQEPKADVFDKTRAESEGE